MIKSGRRKKYSSFKLGYRDERILTPLIDAIGRLQIKRTLSRLDKLRKKTL